MCKDAACKRGKAGPAAGQEQHDKAARLGSCKATMSAPPPRVVAHERALAEELALAQLCERRLLAGRVGGAHGDAPLLHAWTHEGHVCSSRLLQPRSGLSA